VVSQATWQGTAEEVLLEDEAVIDLTLVALTEDVVTGV
jgi:hypothetical protein